MREALHIFLKDSRHLRYPIAVVLAWTAMFLATSAVPPADPSAFGWSGYVIPVISAYVLPAAWWLLISRAFHAEALPGDRQFWLTRPYSRVSLFGAKALFVLAYITLPMVLAQAVVVVARGLPLVPSLPAIMWTQLLMLAVVVLPAAAVAALTSTLAQFVVVGLAAPFLLEAKNLLSPWASFEWVRASVEISAIAVAATGVLWLQFKSRRTRASRLLALSAILFLVATLPFLSWRTAFAWQSRLAQDLDARLTAELVRPEPRPLGAADPFKGPIPLSFRVAGPPPGTPIRCESGEVAINDGAERLWSSGLTAIGIIDSAKLSEVPAGCTFYFRLPETHIKNVVDRKVTLRAVLYITVFGSPQFTRLPIGEPPTVVSSAGLCAATMHPIIRGVGSDRPDQPATQVVCQSAFRAPAGIGFFAAGSSKDKSLSRESSYSPFPAELRLQPVDYFATMLRTTDAVTVETWAPVSHVRTEVEAVGIHLTDFDLRLGR